MAFPSILSRILPHKRKHDLFLGLMLRESSATGYAFEHTSGDLEILKSKSFPYSKGFDKILEDVDTVVYEMESELRCHFDRVIFVLPTSGVKESGGEVVAPYRTAISEIVHNLELDAMGYIEMLDVLKSDLNTRGSEVYVELGKLKTQLVFLHAGESRKRVTISTNPANIVSHIDEFVTRGRTVSILPIHEGANTNVLSAALSGYLPHIYTIHEVNVEVRKLLKLQLDSNSADLKTSPGTTAHDGETSPNGSDRSSVSEPQEEDAVVIDTQHVRIDSQDTSDIHPEPSTADTQDLKPQDIDAPQTATHSDQIAGFKLYHQQPSVEDDYIHPPADIQEQGTIPLEGYDDEPSTMQDELTSQTSHEVSSASDEPTDNVVTPIRMSPVSKTLVMTIGALLCVVVAGTSAFELFLHRVTLIVTVPTEVYEIKQDILAVPVTKVIEEKDIDVQVATSGEREIGELAEGTVTIASFNDKEASFSAGTNIYLRDMAFRLDEDVVLPASSVDTTSGTKRASQKSVKASATFIGTEGNVEKGSQFTVEDYPTSLYYGRAESAFTGGSAQTVSVVSADDLAKLESEVDDVAKQASDSARAGTSGDMLTLDSISTVDTSELEYSAEVGELASSLRATGKVKAVLYTVSKPYLVDLITKMIRENKGQGYQFLNDGVSYTFTDVSLASDEQTIDALLTSSVSIFRAVDLPAIKQAVRLQSREQVQAYLRSKIQASSVSFVYDPIIPVFDRFVPWDPKNIELQVDPSDGSSD